MAPVEVRSKALFANDQPDGVVQQPCRASSASWRSWRVPHLINEAVVGMALAQGQQRPRDMA
jgi:hypothetical protein